MIIISGVGGVLAELQGMRVRRGDFGDPTSAGLIARGLPESRADMPVGPFAASRQGDSVPVGPSLP